MTGAGASAAPRRITILGSTGSIGTNTLDVMARHPQQFEAFALTAHSRVDMLLAQCRQFRPAFAVVSQVADAVRLQAQCRELGLPTQVLHGPGALEEVAADERVDMVMAAIVGAAGLPACLRAAWAGKRLLLANKEALVVGGEVFLEAVRTGGATLLPIDSEHSAVFQSLPEDPSTWARRIQKIMLTSSGGPFRTRAPATLREVTPAEACTHPNFAMGRKISVDSATMMNKALEVIEAKYLFGVAPAQVEVVIHPQQIIHSMVQFHDASVVAQLGTPDMRVPIAYGLSWPERIASGAPALDFMRLGSLTFESAHEGDHLLRYPGLRLAWQALEAPAGSTAVLNAANEVAVAAFLDGALRFDQIHSLNVETLQQVPVSSAKNLDDLLALDALARAHATGLARQWRR